MRNVCLFLFLVMSCAGSKAQDTTVFEPGEVQKAAEYPGGMAAVLQHIGRQLRVESTEEGFLLSKLAVSFIVEKDGSTSRHRVEMGDTGWLPQVQEIFKGMLPWQPAEQEGKKVRMVCRIVLNICYK